jgi:hypothetical protein
MPVSFSLRRSKNEQLMEVVVSGPGRANRLKLRRNGGNFAPGFRCDERRTAHVAGWAYIGAAAVSPRDCDRRVLEGVYHSPDPSHRVQVDWAIESVDADWDDESDG